MFQEKEEKRRNANFCFRKESKLLFQKRKPPFCFKKKKKRQNNNYQLPTNN